MHSPIAALGLDCWLRVNKLFNRTSVLLTIAVATLCGCGESPRTFQQMSSDDRMNYLRAQADEAMLVEATNVVPNIRDVIEEHANTFADSVDQWRGWLRVEYTDFSGGEQRTNIPMAFLATFDGHLFGCAPNRADAGLITIQ